MNLGIKNKLALITGSSKGIGRAIATELAKEGAQLILVARTEKHLKELSRELANSPKPHYYFATNLMAVGAPEKLAKSILKGVGAPQIIVHNLGGSLGITDFFRSSDEWNKV